MISLRFWQIKSRQRGSSGLIRSSPIPIPYSIMVTASWQRRHSERKSSWLFVAARTAVGDVLHGGGGRLAKDAQMRVTSRAAHRLRFLYSVLA